MVFKKTSTTLCRLLTFAIGILASTSPAQADSTAGDIYVRPLPGFNDSIRKTKMLNDEGKVITTIAYGVEDAHGHVAVCGMVLHTGEIDRRAFAGVMANSGIATGGKELLTDLRYFREFIAPDRLLVACKISEHQWEPRYGKQPSELVFRGEFQR